MNAAMPIRADTQESCSFQAVQLHNSKSTGAELHAAKSSVFLEVGQ